MASVIVLEVAVARPADDVWAVINDYAREADWQTNVIELVAEPPGPARPGTRVRKARRTPMGVQRFVTEVVDVDTAARSQRDRVATGSFAGTTGHWTVVPDGDRCRVRIEIEAAAVGIWRLLLPVIRAGMQKQMREELESLRRMIEAAPR